MLEDEVVLVRFIPGTLVGHVLSQTVDQGTVLRLGCRNCTDEAPPTTFNSQGEGMYDQRGALVYLRPEYGF